MMRKNLTILSLHLALFASLACAQPAATGPAATHPAEPAVSKDAMALLDRLEKAGEKHKTIQATLDYLFEDRLTGDSEHRTGQVCYQRETETTPAKFRVQFETLQQGEGKPFVDKVAYAFDGQFLTVIKHRTKEITRYQLPPGQNMGAMKLGQGPFPLPFGQKTKDMLAFFDVQTRSADQKPAADEPPEPADTDYLLLITRAEKRKDTNIDRAKMWIDRGTGLPVRIISRENKTKRTTTVNFKDIKTNVPMTEETFLLPKPPGYELHVEKFEPGKSITP